MSAAELDVLRRLLRPAAGGDGIEADGCVGADDLAAAGLSGREARELVAKLDPVERPDFSLDLTRMRTAEEMAEHMAEAVPETAG